MKDSLQPGRSVYEILGVAENVNSDGIMKAFRLALPGCRDLQALSEARNTLSDPGQRLLADLFLYQDSFLTADLPWRPDPDSLITRRKELAGQIEDAYRAGWWNFRCLHTFAVLWLWWAVTREEKNLAAVKGIPGPVCPVLPGSIENWWEPAVMGWTILIAAQDFWQDWSRIKHYGLPQDAADRLQANLVSRLNNYADEYNKVQAKDDFKRIQKTEELLRSEISIARRLAAAGVRLGSTEGQSVAAGFGRQTLEWLGLGDLVRDELARRQKTEPDSQSIQSLVKELSAYGQMHQQVKNRRYDQTIRQILALPEKEINSEEVQQILLAAYLEKGSQLAELGQWPSAMATFIQALQNCLEINQPIIRKKATDLLRPYIAKLQLSDQPAADLLLDKAFTLLDDEPDLLKKAIDLHINQAIALINGVAEADREKPELSRNQAIEQVKKGIAMLESSSLHGSKRAKENLAKARAMLKNLEQGMWGVSSGVQSQMNQAVQLANQKNFSEAIKVMDKIKDQIPKGEQGKFNTIFGDICNVYGVQLLNEAVEGVKNAKETSKEIEATQKAVRKYLKGSKGKVKFSDIFVLFIKLLVLFWFSYGTYWMAGRIPGIQENQFLKYIAILVIFIIDLLIVIRMIKNLGKHSKTNKSKQKQSWRASSLCARAGCTSFAQYEFDLTKYGYRVKVPLCDWHGKEMQKLIAPKIDAYAGMQLYFAVEQFKRAKALNPNNSTIKENLKTAEDIQSRYH